jgi:hypothetical protein
MPSHHEFPAELVWIEKYDPLPNTCCDCGLFTDHRVTVKHVDLISQSGSSSDGCGPVMLALVIHVALGPVGWLLSALMHGDETEKTKTVKQKSKIKIPQCHLCHGMKPPEVVESQISSFSFHVHPRFKQRFEELKREAETES